MAIDSNPVVRDILGGQLLLSIPYIKGLFSPVSFLTWVVAVLAIMPFIVWIVCIAVILINAMKWVKSNGNEKEVESAKTGIKRALVGFASMFLLFILANLMSYFFIGHSFDTLATALAPCRIPIYTNSLYTTTQTTYVFEYSRTYSIPLDQAYKTCGYK